MAPLYNTFLTAGNIFFQLIYYLILIRVILSWIRPNPGNKFVNMVNNLTEPILEPFRKVSSRFNMGMIDLSPLIAIIVIQFIIHPIYRQLIFMIFK